MEKGVPAAGSPGMLDLSWTMRWHKRRNTWVVCCGNRRVFFPRGLLTNHRTFTVGMMQGQWTIVCHVIYVLHRKPFPVSARTTSKGDQQHYCFVSGVSINKDIAKTRAALGSGRKTAGQTVTHLFLRGGRTAKCSTRQGDVANDGKRCQGREERS